MINAYKQYCISLQSTGKYRKLPDISFVADKSSIDFSTNDYLSLSKNDKLLHSAIAAAKQYGIGSTGSRLLSGNNKITMVLERQIALDKHTEAALVFISGFQANLTVLASLLNKTVLQAEPIVFFDKLNHSSLYQAALSSRAKLLRYQHNDMQHLSDLIMQYQNDPNPKFIVTETVFGMDGSILRINELLSIAMRHNAFVYLDEAHATGVMGYNGYGLSTNCNFQDIPHVIMGTFSKALGCTGAYVACSQILKEYFINKVTGFIYSTAPSPAVIGAASQAWSMIRDFNDQRQLLFSRAANMRNQLNNLGFNIGKSETHIIPIILGKEELVVFAKNKLLQQNIVVSSILPSTVPPGTARLRIAINTSHTENDIMHLIATLKYL